MNTFPTVRDAKEFLIGKIISEAQIENVPLSDIERKMLYFSETGWTLPEMDEISNTFDREYDQKQYEKKMAALIRNLCNASRKDNPDEFNAWKNAVKVVRAEDHYLLVLIDAAEARWWQFLKS